MRFLIFSLVLLSSVSAQARFRALPLMPPREYSSASSPRTYTIHTAQPVSSASHSSRLEKQALGFELATLGTGNASNGDALGLQLLYGLRVNYLMPIWDTFFLKPSLGYFRRDEKTGSVKVTQNDFEAGVTLSKSLSESRSFLWHAGVANRLDYLTSSISVTGSSASSPGEWRYRVGPATGIRWSLGSGMDLTADFELGVTFTQPVKAQTSLGTGLVFLLD